MTENQYWSYWKLLREAHRVHNAATRDAGVGILTQAQFRSLVHERAFGRNISAKLIDKGRMFDAFKAACLAILKPNSVDAQLAQANMERTRREYRLDELVLESIGGPDASAYWRKLCRDKFGHDDVGKLTEDQYAQLRNTFCARNTEWRSQPSTSNDDATRGQPETALVPAGESDDPF